MIANKVCRECGEELNDENWSLQSQKYWNDTCKECITKGRQEWIKVFASPHNCRVCGDELFPSLYQENPRVAIAGNITLNMLNRSNYICMECKRTSARLSRTRLRFKRSYNLTVDKSLTQSQLDSLEKAHRMDGVHDALTTNRQFAFNNVAWWKSHGQDIETIAENIKTSVDVVNDLIKEFETDEDRATLKTDQRFTTNYTQDVLRGATDFLRAHNDEIQTAIVANSEFSDVGNGEIKFWIYEDVAHEKYSVQEAVYIIENCETDEMVDETTEYTPLDVMIEMAGYSYSRDVWYKAEELFNERKELHDARQYLNR